MTGQHRLDFTSALFLGLRHPPSSLRRWVSLTTGKPAVLAEPSTACTVAAAVATSHGAQAGVVGRSSLHALLDVMELFNRPEYVIAVDAASYPIAMRASLLGAAGGAMVFTYPHHRPGRIVPPRRGRLVIVTDGWCPSCNQPAPLAELQARVRGPGGWLIVDDSLAYGVLGDRCAGPEFGDGSGTLRWSGLDHDQVIWVSSMAKAYGAPLAVTTGDRTTIGRLARQGGNRVHSSPPSAGDLAAAEAAVRAPARAAGRRSRLLAHTLHLRGALREAGVPAVGRPFPVVSVRLPDPGEGWKRWRTLRDRGIRTVVQQPRCGTGALLSMLVRADHADAEVVDLVRALRATRLEAGTA